VGQSSVVEHTCNLIYMEGGNWEVHDLRLALEKCVRSPFQPIKAGPGGTHSSSQLCGVHK
jgi:hypothetical protein